MACTGDTHPHQPQFGESRRLSCTASRPGYTDNCNQQQQYCAPHQQFSNSVYCLIRKADPTAAASLVRCALSLPPPWPPALPSRCIRWKVRKQMRKSQGPVQASCSTSNTFCSLGRVESRLKLISFVGPFRDIVKVTLVTWCECSRQWRIPSRGWY